MKKIFLIAFLLLRFSPVSFALTGEQILKKVDRNMLFTTAKYTARMIIKTGTEKALVTRKKKMLIYSRGRDKTFAEFLYPKKDKGIKYLKIGDNLWMYLPGVEKIIKIAGHMLSRSMMGSDFSYEDSMETSSLFKKYKAAVVGSEKINGHNCYVVELTAKIKAVTYFKRKVWIDKVRFVARKEELYAKSGKLLKVMTISKIKYLGGGRYYPVFMTMRNKLKKGSRTDFIIDSIQLNVRLPSGIFSQRNLRKK